MTKTTSSTLLAHLTGGALALALLVVTGDVRAAETTHELVMKGLDLRRSGEPARALEVLERAHAQDPSPMTLAQIGIAEQSLKRWADAETHLASALHSAAFPWIAKNRPFLTQSLESVRRHLGQLVIRGTPAGASVYVDGQGRGTLPLPAAIRLSEGQASVQITAPGRQPFIKSVSITAESAATIEADLDRVAVPSEIVPDAHTVSLPTPRALQLDREPGREWPPAKIAGVGLLGAGIAAIATGAVLLLVVDGRRACEAPEGSQCSEVRDARPAAWGLIGSGVLAGAAGSFLLYRNSRSDVSLALSLGRGVVATGHF